jgi:hypothetical protein
MLPCVQSLLLECAISNNEVLFQAGQADKFQFEIENLGNIESLELSHGGAGGSVMSPSSWFVDEVLPITSGVSHPTFVHSAIDL